ncbi:MAG: DUF116 domain-containing protein [Candidatus Zixiibacteriota bacterium]|nr:MAG: DUF116 domain-containing protein [candidate division Zixibacteria bacterium]
MKSKWIFLRLSILSLAILAISFVALWYLIAPRLEEFNVYLAWVIRIALIASLGTIAMGLGLIVLSSATERDFLWPHGEKQVTVKVLFPLNIVLGRLLGISKDTVRSSFVGVNNSLVKASRKRLQRGKVLILLSQCLQNFDCPHRVTATHLNCKRCGKCQLGEIITLKEKYEAELAVATGGTLARKIIVDTRPSAIVAVACERDLTSGIQDAYPVPVLGVLNRRPYGPCYNTEIDLDRLETAVEFMSNGCGNAN